MLSDYKSGRTDRVVWEYEANDLKEIEKEIEASEERMMADPQGQAFMNQWFAKLTDLIHYSEVENWNVN